MGSPKQESFNQGHPLELAFITISDQNALKDPARQQLARTQAIKHSLQRKRRELQLASKNFVDETPSTIARRRKRQEERDEDEVAESSRRSSPNQPVPNDPWEPLSIQPSRLAELLRHSTARQVGKPVSSVNDAIDYQCLRDVFGVGIEDAVLASALCLTLAFSATGGVLDDECAAYRLQVIQSVNARLSDPAEATSTSTVGAILLLVGVEAHLGERETAQIHLNGTRELLRLCDQRKAYLSDAVRRAIFWQDLFCSIVTGSARVLSHETFPEMHWHRDPYRANLYSVPSGFAGRIEVLGLEFLDVVEDICGLQYLRENGTNYPLNNLEVETIDNQQAWIESRLQQLGQSATEPLLICCIPAAYLCGYSFFSEIWGASLIPSRLSEQLLHALQFYEAWQGWEGNADLLLWLLNIGAAFAANVPIKLGFTGLWHGSQWAKLQPLCSSREEVEKHLKTFIWSDLVYGSRHGAF